MPDFRTRCGRALLIVVLALQACGDDRSSSGQTACDPLAAQMQPLELGMLVGSGEDARGVVYAAEDGDEARVYVSSGDELVRKRVLGAGQISEGGRTTYVFHYEEGDAVHSLVIVSRAGEPESMTFFDREVEALETSGGVKLSPIDASSLAQLELVNLPGGTLVEYFAETEAGDVLLVTRPEDDWSYEDFRVFYGPKSAIRERKVTEVTRARDGGSTFVVFEVDSKQATASFPVESRTDEMGDVSFEHGQATLELDGETLPLAWPDPPSTLTGLSITCRD